VLYLAPLHKDLLTEGRVSHFRVLRTTGRRVISQLEVLAASHLGQKPHIDRRIEGCEVSRADIELSVKTTT